VGKHGNEEIIMNCVKNQGRNPKEYKKIYDNKQLCLIEEGSF
jgi:hypothetical protein